MYPSNPPVESIPALIKGKRKERGLTQRALGEACGYTGASAERVVQLWEYGKQSVPVERMRSLATTLGIPVDLLIP